MELARWLLTLQPPTTTMEPSTTAAVWLSRRCTDWPRRTLSCEVKVRVSSTDRALVDGKLPPKYMMLVPTDTAVWHLPVKQKAVSMQVRQCALDVSSRQC